MNAFGTSYRGSTFSERMAAAPCRQSDPDLSFPNGSGKLSVQHEQAKADCARCPLALREECLEIAMRSEGNTAGATRYGVFGGMDPTERAALAKERQAALRERVTSEHGTPARARKHRRAGEAPCGPCLAAETDARRNGAKDKGWPKKRVAA